MDPKQHFHPCQGCRHAQTEVSATYVISRTHTCAFSKQVVRARCIGFERKPRGT